MTKIYVFKFTSFFIFNWYDCRILDQSATYLLIACSSSSAASYNVLPNSTAPAETAATVAPKPNNLCIS